jgi:hypothetical protein
MTDLAYVALAVLFVGFIMEGLVLLGVMRQLGALLLEVKPDLPQDVGGGPDPTTALDLASLGYSERRGGVLFAFVSPNCQMCEALHSPMLTLAERYPAVSVAAVIAYGSQEERGLLVQTLDGIARPDLAHLVDEWEIPGTPYVVSTDASGRIRARGVVSTSGQLEMMAEASELSPDAHERALRELEARGASFVQVSADLDNQHGSNGHKKEVRVHE